MVYRVVWSIIWYQTYRSIDSLCECRYRTRGIIIGPPSMFISLQVNLIYRAAFSFFERRKTKTKASTPANYKRRRQSKKPTENSKFKHVAKRRKTGVE